MWFLFSFVTMMTLKVTFSADCLCVTGSTKKIYTGPDISREVIGLAIRGECLPIAHTNEENSAWVAVDFKKNIIFHQFHIIGYIVRDGSVVHQQCIGGQGISFLTTTEPYISYSQTVTTTEETLTTGSMAIDTKYTSTTSDKMTTSTIPTDNTSTATDLETSTNVPSIFTSPKLPDKSSPTKGMETTQSTTGQDTKSPITESNGLFSTTHFDVNTDTTIFSSTSDDVTSTSLPLTQTTTQNQNTDHVDTTSHGTSQAPKPLTVSTTTTGKYVTSSVATATNLPGNTTTTSMAIPTDSPCNPGCSNGGICVTDPFVTCLCSGSWIGTSCDLCAGTPCDQGECITVGTTAKCVCDPGYTGVSCNETLVCNSSEISIGGSCYTFNYVYEACQENYCQNHPGTECLVNSEGIYCLCKDEFNPSDSSPCGCPVGQVRHLNGTCVEIDCRGVSSCSHGSCYFRSFYNFGCLCDEGWEGENCDMVLTQCGDHHCYNNGTCVRDPDVTCQCADAWTGAECDMCGSQECHHGVCILDRYKQPMCVCDKEYGGPKCDQVMKCSGQEFGGHCYGNDLDNFTPCVENVCLSGQLCVAALHTFKNDLYCVCKENVTEAYLTSDCGCPERSLRNYRGECIDILL
ncbi:protein jagged-2-like [Argopecten irradians]|uniref:protein jagged-2-like n=1 Tax=Argopecten irradians TaxID=31199 RepID=UPI003718D3B2